MSEFVKKPSTETKIKRELKFQLYADGVCEKDIGGWCSLIIDKNEKKTILSGKENEVTKQIIEMFPIIEGLEWIYNTVETKKRKHINVTIFTDSPYCVNLLKEWLDMWKDDLDSRPNSELLKKLYELKRKIKIESKWAQKVLNENTWTVDRVSNEQIKCEEKDLKEENV